MKNKETFTREEVLEFATWLLEVKPEFIDNTKKGNIYKVFYRFYSKKELLTYFFKKVQPLFYAKKNKS